MRLSVSNIAWDNSELDEHLALLKELGCDGVEIAPSCIWKEPIHASNEDIEWLRRLISGYRLIIPAFHALLYGKELYLFGDRAKRQETVSYLKKLIQLAGRLSVKVLVYGSPASRRVGNRPYEECYGIAVEVFRELGTEAELNSTYFCIEPLGFSETDFIHTADEGYKLIEDVAAPHFSLHLDIKAMAENREDFGNIFKKYATVLRHLHVGDTGLAPPGFTGLDHGAIGRAVRNSSYDRFISIEMKKGFGDSKQVIRDSVRYVRKNYFGE